jgi:hypothetical protein
MYRNVVLGPASGAAAVYALDGLDACHVHN